MLNDSDEENDEAEDNVEEKSQTAQNDVLVHENILWFVNDIH